MSRTSKSLAALLVGTLAGGAAAQTFLISEIVIDVPSTDNGFEAVEIVGPASTALTGYFLLSIEGDGGNAGIVDQVIDLGAASTGTNGLLLLRDAATVLLPAPDGATSVVVDDFNPDLENGSNSFLLGFGTPPALNADLDADNDGTLDAGALTGFSVDDAVGFIENDGPTNVAYADDVGGTNTGPFVDFNSDSLYRIFNADGTPCAWAGGDVLSAVPGGPYSYDFGTGETFGFAEQGIAAIDANFGSANLVPDDDNDGIANGCDDPSAWTDERSALAGVAGDPLLVGTGTLVAASPNSLDLTNAAPSAPAAAFVALASVPAPFKGGTLKAFPPLTIVFAATSGAGGIALPFLMPAGVPAGTEIWVQWGIQDAAAVKGVALSNAVKGLVP